MSLIDAIAAAVEPWNRLYSHSTVVSTAVTFTHVGSLVVGGGFAIASDRATLRIRAAGAGRLRAAGGTGAAADTNERRRFLQDFDTIHRPVVAAIGFMAASGIAMALADVETFLVSPLFWTKMGLVLLLLANGLNVARTGHALMPNPAASNPLWHRLTRGAVASITLWLTTTLFGVVLMGS